MLTLQPTVGFSLLGDFLPFHPFLGQSTLLFPSSGYHPQHLQSIFFLVSSDSPTHWLPFQYSSRHSPSIHPHHVYQPGHSSSFYKSYYVCISCEFIQFRVLSDSPNSIFILHWAKNFLNIFHSNILNFCSFRLVNVQVSYPYVTTSLIQQAVGQYIFETYVFFCSYCQSTSLYCATCHVRHTELTVKRRI